MNNLKVELENIVKINKLTRIIYFTYVCNLEFFKNVIGHMRYVWMIRYT